MKLPRIFTATALLGIAAFAGPAAAGVDVHIGLGAPLYYDPGYRVYEYYEPRPVYPRPVYHYYYEDRRPVYRTYGGSPVYNFYYRDRDRDYRGSRGRDDHHRHHWHDDRRAWNDDRRDRREGRGRGGRDGRDGRGHHHGRRD